jgi:hypothetical protein
LRLLLTGAGGFLIALVASWLVSGQALGGLPSYLKYMLEISSGYSSAMASEEAGLGWQYATVLAVLVLGLYAAYATTKAWPNRRRYGLALIWALFWFSWFKEGFVRHDSIHAIWGFNGLLAGFSAFQWRSGKRSVGTICLAALVLLALAAQSQSLTGDLHPRASATAFFDDLSDYTAASKQAGFEHAGRASIRAAEPIAPGMLSKLREHTVAVFPVDLALAWAYNLRWDPMPVLQSYSAYTSGLDALDASFLRSARAPQRILYEGADPIDGRIGSFDQGETFRTMLCNYRVIDTTATLELLARIPDRCPGRSRQLAVVHANWGQTIRVPDPPRGSWIEYVGIYGTGSSGLGQLRSLFFKPTDRFVQINGGGDARLVTGTAADGLPLQVPTRLDFGGPFDLGLNATTISVIKGSGGLSGGKPLTYAFYVERIR